MKKICLFIVLVSLLAGCLMPSADRGRKNNDKPHLDDLAYLEIWKSDIPKHQLVGYVEESTISFPGSFRPSTIYYIKDKFFKALGFVTETGDAYSYPAQGNPVKIGDFTLEVAARRLLNLTGVIYFKKLEPSIVVE